MQKAALAVGGAVAAGMTALLMLIVLVSSSDEANAAPGMPGVVCAPPGGKPGDPVAGFAGPQLANAAAIVTVGVEMGVPQRAQVIAVATAIQESKLLMYANSTVPASLGLPHDRVGSDHDSVGLFQQRASWGPLAIRMDARKSAQLFYARLLAVPGWQSMSLSQAAQAVQVSAFPDAYARWEEPALALVGSVSGIVCTSPGASLETNPKAQVVIDRALSQQGVPYVWAGGDANGPTKGGFDCSGLIVYAFAGIGVTVPHQTQSIWATFQPAVTDRAQLQPGDMLLFSSNGTAGGIHHVGLYLGDGKMVHAPETGDVVKTVEKIWDSPYWTREFIGAVRAGVPTPQ
ncbi:C40 family peptidase [Pseudonocardia sp. D17]|uniref:C40 family peptidase n=1 Tax=Pseudonocardia sp. D17 TaxID=882661 RepID=UPI0030CE9207